MYPRLAWPGFVAGVWHILQGLPPSLVQALVEATKHLQSQTARLESVSIPSFAGHLSQPGYYSYKWAEVLCFNPFLCRSSIAT